MCALIREIVVLALGKVSNKTSIVTIFGHKHLKSKFNIFYEKFQLPLMLVWLIFKNKIANF